MSNLIEVDGLIKDFGSFWVVDGVFFMVEVGEIFGLFGLNGVGKIIILWMLLGLLKFIVG